MWEVCQKQRLNTKIQKTKIHKPKDSHPVDFPSEYSQNPLVGREMLEMLAVPTTAEISDSVSSWFQGCCVQGSCLPCWAAPTSMGEGRDTVLVALPHPGPPQDFVPLAHHTQTQNQLLNPPLVLFAVKSTEHGAGRACH